MRWSGFFSNRIVPVPISKTIASFATVDRAEAEEIVTRLSKSVARDSLKVLTVFLNIALVFKILDVAWKSALDDAGVVTACANDTSEHQLSLFLSAHRPDHHALNRLAVDVGLLHPDSAQRS